MKMVAYDPFDIIIYDKEKMSPCLAFDGIRRGNAVNLVMLLFKTRFHGRSRGMTGVADYPTHSDNDGVMWITGFSSFVNHLR